MRILLVEDDKNLNQTLLYSLEEEGFDVDPCFDGEEALYYMEETPYDIVLLDRMLPALDGLSVLGQMRKKGLHTPVILLTALGEVDDRIAGLDCGADDYLVKPFDFKELCARIRSILRRPASLMPLRSLAFSDLSFLPDSLALKGPYGSCTLSRREGTLLETFLRSPCVSLSRARLLTHVWGPDSDVEDGNLDNYIYFLRRRLKSLGSTARIVTVRGIGYRLEEESHV